MATISRDPTVLSSDIAVDFKLLRLKTLDQGVYQRYHSGISPEVVKLMKTSHFQAKVREELPRKEFALSRDVQIHVEDSGNVLIREKDGDPWIKIYKKSELESTELDAPIDEIVKKTREAFDDLFPEDLRGAEPLTPERVSASSPCHHHSPGSLRSRDELIHDLRDEVRDLQREITRLKESDSRPPAFKVATLEHGLQSASERIETLPDIKPALLAQNEQLRQQRVEIYDLRHDLTQANKDKAALMLLLTTASQWNNSLQSQLQTTTEELGLTQETLETVLESVDQLKEKNSELEGTLKQRTEHLAKTLALLLGTEALHQQSQAKIAELQEASLKLHEDNTLLTQNLDQRTKELQGALLLLTLASGLYQHKQQQLQTLHDLHRQVSEEKEQLTQELALANAEVKRLSEEALPKEREAQELLQSQLKQAQHQVEDLTPKLLTLTKRVAELEELLEERDEGIRSLDGDVKRLQQQLEEANSSHEEQLKLLRSEKDQLSSEYQQRERELTEQHERRVHELEESAEDLSSQLQTALQRAEKAERLLEAKTSELSDARQEFELQLSSKGEEIRSAKEQAELELRQAQTTYQSEKKQLEHQHQEEILRLESSHEDDLEKQLQLQQKKFENASQSLNEDHERQLLELKTQYDLAFTKSEESYKRTEARLTEEFQLALKTLGLEKKEAFVRVEDLQKRVSELEEILSAAQEKLPRTLADELGEPSLPGKIDSLLQDNKHLEKEMEELQEQLREVKASHLSERERLDESHQQELQQLAEEHQRQIIAIQSEIEGYTDEIGRLRLKVRDLTSTQVRDKQRLHELEETTRELRADLVKADQKVESRDETIQRLRKRVSTVQSESQEKDSVISDYNNELIKSGDQIRELRQTVRVRDKQIEELNQDLSEVAQERDYYSNRLQTKRQENRRISELLDGKNERVIELEKALEQKSREFDQHEQEAQVLIERIERQSQEYSSELLSKISTLEESLEQREHRALELEEENLALRDTVARQEKELIALRAEVKRLRAENHELWEILGRLAVVLNVSIKNGDLEGSKRAIWDATDQLIEANQSLEKTSLVAQRTLGEVACHIGLEESADSVAIQERLEELLQTEKKKNLSHKKEAELLLQQVSSLQEDEPLRLESSSSVSHDRVVGLSDPSAVKAASLQVASGIAKLAQGLGNKPVRLSGLSSRQRQILEYTKSALSNPSSLPGYGSAVGQIESFAKSKATTKNHKGFNQHIYTKNSLFDFIDRIEDFIQSNEPTIKSIDQCQRALQKLITKAKKLSVNGASMSAEEILAVQDTLREIEELQNQRDDLVNDFFKSLVQTIDTRTDAGVNRFTKQATTGSPFPFFAKELMVHLDALQSLDPSYYVGSDRRKELISECRNVEELRVIVEVLHESLGALFSKVEL